MSTAHKISTAKSGGAKNRILVADDHPVVCQALANLLNRQADMTCCGKITSASAVVAAVGENCPDLLLLDLFFKDGEGIGLITTLLNMVPELRVLIISQHEDRDHIERSLKAGARGYLTKLATTREILTAIRTVLQGTIYKAEMSDRLPPDHKAGILARLPHGKPVKLTQRETEVLQLIGAGKRTRDIAMHLNLSHKTIETYRENLKQKLSLGNAAELVNFAITWNGRRADPAADTWTI